MVFATSRYTASHTSPLSAIQVIIKHTSRSQNASNLLIMERPKVTTLTLVPLAKGSVLLPGITLRVPVANRLDVSALLSSIYARAKTPRGDATATLIGCIPLNSPLLSPDGQHPLDNEEAEKHQLTETPDVNPGRAETANLFKYGTVGRITGIQGRRPGQTALIVEGVRRFRVDKIIQQKPYFEAEVTYINEERECLSKPLEQYRELICSSSSY